MSLKDNLYDVLGVSKEASVEEIKKAYRTIAMTCHPDKVRNDDNKKEQEERFKAIQHAYSILSDEKQRKKYDMGDLLENFQTIDDVFEMMFGQGMGMGMGIPGVGVSATQIFINPSSFSSGPFEDEIEDEENEEDFMHGLHKILSSMSGSAMNMNMNNNNTYTPAPPKNKNVDGCYRAECFLGLKDILRGGVKSNVPYKYVKKCIACNGFRCFACQGVRSSNCKSCYGGCRECNNTGLIDEERNIDVSFQPGIRHGDIIKVSLKNTDRTLGTVEVTMLHNLSDRVQIDGANIVIFVDISVVELLLGFETNIHLPDDANTKLTIRKEEYFDPLTSHDVFEGLGLLRDDHDLVQMKKNKKGDVLIKYRITYPSPDEAVMVKFKHMLRNKVQKAPKGGVT
jgi:DnaJ-class molecular chaperone